jgi:hypothetical protein
MGLKGNLDTAHFAALLKRNGEPLYRYLSRVGPCPHDHNHSLTGFRPDGDCPLCGGTGEVFESLDLDQIGAASAAGGKVLLLNALETKKRQPIELTTNQAQCSFLPTDYPMAEGDRLQFLTRDAWHSELFTFNPDADDAVTGQRLRYWPVLEVQSVYTRDGKLSPALYAISDNEQAVTFTEGAVAAGAQVTVKYRYRKQWVVVTESTLDRVAADNGDRFPSRCILKSWSYAPLDAQEGDL